MKSETKSARSLMDIRADITKIDAQYMPPDQYRRLIAPLIAEAHEQIPDGMAYDEMSREQLLFLISAMAR